MNKIIAILLLVLVLASSSYADIGIDKFAHFGCAGLATRYLIDQAHLTPLSTAILVGTASICWENWLSDHSQEDNIATCLGVAFAISW